MRERNLCGDPPPVYEDDEPDPEGLFGPETDDI
jgi:hypothetical protein